MKTYSNDQISVSFDKDVCIHSEKCIKGLPSVFNLEARPWINVNGASTQEIVGAIKACPSGALTYKLAAEEAKAAEASQIAVQVVPKGPYVIKGYVVITGENNETIEKEGTCALCRCGASQNKPFCDGSHRNVDF